MWEISEGDIKFLCIVKLVLQESLGLREPKVTNQCELSFHALFDFSVLGDAS